MERQNGFSYAISALVLISYYLSAKLSFFIEPVPGFLYHIWLPAGVAFSAVVFFGASQCINIMIAALLFNLISKELNNISFSLIISFAEACQAFLGYYLFEKYFKQSQNVESIKNILIFLLIGCAIGIINAIFYTSGFYLYENLIEKDIIVTFINYWLASTIGILLISPIFISIKRDSEVFNKKNAFIVIFSIVISITFISIFIVLKKSSLEQDKLKISKQADEFIISVENKIKSSGLFLSAIKGLYDASNYVDRDEFRTFVSWELKHESSIKAVEWAPKVSLSEKNKYETEAKKYYKNFSFFENLNGKKIPVRDRNYYYPVYYLEPLKGNEYAFGFDLGSNKERMNAMISAARNGELVLSSPLDLIQINSRGVLFFKAIYKKNMPLNNRQEREIALEGFALAVFDINSLLADVIENIKKDKIDVYIYDLNTLSGHVYGEEEKNYYYRYNNKLSIYGQTWEFNFYLKDNYLGNIWYLLGIMVLSIIFIFFIWAFFQIINLRIEIINDLVEQKTDLLNKSNEKLIKANNAKSLFLSNMSHEIRTPLTAILGNTEILVNKFANRGMLEETGMMKRILMNGEHLMHLINDILDFSKIEANKLKIEKIFFNLGDLIDSTEHIFLNLSKDKGISLTIKKDENLPEKIKSDEVRIKQVLINLLSNAVKFTSTKGKVECNITFDSENYELKVQVSDTGVGINEDKIESLFAAFVQADESTTREFGGTGLGLSICKQLCCLMGGDLTCTSELKVGSTFTATFIVDEFSFEKNDAKNKVKDDFKHKHFKGVKILVAEDWRDNQAIISWHLENLGIKFDIVDDGRQAVNYASVNRYDLILMDIQMPVLDGIEATKEIKKQNNKIPVIAVTANAMKEQVDSYLQMGFDGFLAKPYRAKELHKVIGEFLCDREEEVVQDDCNLDDFESSPAFTNIKEKFLNSFPDEIKSIKELKESSKMLELIRIIHNIKSSAQTLGMMDVGKYAEELEILFSNRKEEEANEKLEAFYKILQEKYDGFIKEKKN